MPSFSFCGFRLNRSPDRLRHSKRL